MSKLVKDALFFRAGNRSLLTTLSVILLYLKSINLRYSSYFITLAKALTN